MKNYFISNNFFLLILLSAIWGSAFIAIKVSVAFINPISVASLRLVVGSLILLFFFLLKRYSFYITKKNFFLIIIIGIIGNLIPFMLISWSEKYIQSNTAGLLLSVGPIFTLILSHFLTKDDKFTFLKFTSIFIGLVGAILIVGLDTIFNLTSGESENFLPKIAIILAALGYVISAIMAYNLKNIDTVTITTFVTISAAIISIPFMIYAEFLYPSQINKTAIFSIIYLGIFPTALAFHLRFYIISKAGPIFLSYVAYLIPVFAIIWGYIFLKEKIDLQVLIGVILVLVGVFISRKNSNK